MQTEKGEFISHLDDTLVSSDQLIDNCQTL